MKRRSVFILLDCVCCFLPSSFLHAQRIKIMVDQDARGPATTDMQSILIFLQSDKFDVLGITTVSGDQWVKEETQRTLRLLEIAGRTDVPVVAGRRVPSAEFQRRDRALGSTCTGSFVTRVAGAIFPSDPDNVPPAFRAGISRTGCRPDAGRRRAAHQSLSTRPLPISLFAWCISIPGEVVIWAGGPLTNIALALRLDPRGGDLGERAWS